MDSRDVREQLAIRADRDAHDERRTEAGAGRAAFLLRLCSFAGDYLRAAGGTDHDYPRQSAVRALVTDRDGTDYAFHISNNNGVSSSILEMKLHREMFPEVSCERTITLTSTTLVSLLSREHIPLSHYDGLILDTQGSELLVLQGALQILPAFRFIKTEVTDFESYAGGCQLKDLDRFLAKLEFREVRRRSSYRRHASGGRYYDVVYQNSKPLVESSHLM